MPRIPPIAPPELHQRDTDIVTQVRDYRLITPLFGGGVKTGEADPVSTVRATEVRGQLRFWWRATRGGQFGTIEYMKHVEDMLWGSTSQPSLVEVEVTCIAEGVPFQATDNNGRPIHVGKPASRYSYGAFPLNDKPGSFVVEEVSFRLTIRFPKDWTPDQRIQLAAWYSTAINTLQKDVEAALWAWETFGGLGARTRRGFGALQIKPAFQAQSKPMSESLLREWIEQGLQAHVVSGRWPDDVPHLTSTAKFVVKPEQNPMQAWQTLLDRLKEFRQARTGRFGRSRWPEPEAIRRRTSQRLAKHAPLTGPDKFPRAAFGLPIVFQFKDRNKANPNDPASDPRTTTLQGQPAGRQRFDRLSSPLILRPVVHPEGQSARLAIVLAGTRLPPTGLLLKDASPTLTPNAVLTPSEASLIAPIGGNTDVIQAFLNTL